MKKVLLACCLSLALLTGVANEPSPETLCKERVSQLKKLVKQAQKQEIDTQREEGALWMAKTFMFYADWDAKNVPMNTYQFSCWPPYADDAARLARELPDFERGEVVKLLDASIKELTDVINGDVIRRSVPRIDWNSITIEGDRFVNNGRPVFANDYGSRPDYLASDYCGKIYKGGLSLDSYDFASGEISKRAQAMFDNDPGTSGHTLMGHGTPPQYLLDIDPSITDGGRHFLKYDIDNPLIRESWEKVFAEMVPRMKDRNFTNMGYVLANEPHFFTEKNVWATGPVSEYTKEKFKVWLKQKHKDIARLNSLWESNFASFDDVTIEIPFDVKIRTTPMGYDWFLFNQDRTTEWFKFLGDGIRKYDPNASIHIKLIPRFFTDDIRDHGLDFERLMNISEVLGNDSKIQGRLIKSQEPEPWEKYYAFSWNEVGIAYDFMESVSPGKPNMNSESHFLSSAGWRNLYLTPEWTRASYWLATLQGMNISYTWYWAREKDGGPRYDLRRMNVVYENATGKSYVGSIAHQPAVANEVSKTYMDFNAYGEEIMALQSIDRPSRIFYSECSAINNPTYMERMYDLYYPLYFKRGNAVGFATQNVIETQDNNSWDVILVRNTEFVRIEEVQALQSYLDNGGSIVIDDISLQKNEYGEPLNMELQSSNGTIYRVDSTDSIDQYLSKSDEILTAKGSMSAINIKESNSTGREGCVYRSYAKDKNTTVLCIINIGCGDAQLEISCEKGLATIKNMFTGKSAKSSFEMKSLDVLMLEIGHEFDPAFNF